MRHLLHIADRSVAWIERNAEVFFALMLVALVLFGNELIGEKRLERRINDPCGRAVRCLAPGDAGSNPAADPDVPAREPAYSLNTTVHPDFPWIEGYTCPDPCID